jgi:DNA-binding transcriptional regulator YiaG
MNGQEIKKLRIKLELSQERFAREVGVSLNTVNRWENDGMQPSQLAIQAIENVKIKYNIGGK